VLREGRAAFSRESECVMKTSFKTVLLLFVLSLPVVVQAQFTFTTNSAKITITGYTGSGGVVAIPDTTNGYPVTSIGSSAFRNKSTITSITIPDRVTSIGLSAFYSCTSLTDVTLGTNVTSIAASAFSGCTSLTSITIPSSVTNITTADAFYGCTSLKELMVDARNPVYSSVAGIMYNKSQTSLFLCPGCMPTADAIPNTVTNIAAQAFYQCCSLNRVMIPASVSIIRDHAFAYCTILREIYFYGKPPVLGSSVFGYDNYATVFYLPGTTNWGTTFGGRPTGFLDATTQLGYTTNGNTITIKGCAGGGTITVPDTLSGLPVASIGDYAFYRHSSLTNITIPYSVTNIGSAVFDYCSSLSAITVASSNSFYSSMDGVLFDKSQSTLVICPAGKAGSYTVPDGITSIAGSAFDNCATLTSVTIPDSVTTIGGSAFWFCTSLTNVNIPDGVTSIGTYAFWGCDRLTSFSVPSSVTNIGPAAFLCASLTAITVDAANCFYSSEAGVLFDKSQTTLLEYPPGSTGSYTIPNSVAKIRDRAFCECNLTNVTIPCSVGSIEQLAFGYCSNLTGVYFQGNAPSLDSRGFDHASKASVYYLPGTTGWGSTFGGLPTAPWLLPCPLILNSSPGFGLQTNGFGFIISWATNIPVAVEACTDLANPLWSPVGTNTLTNGSSYFSDPQWTNYPTRFYRLRSP
jgi:hypothetical protein